MNYKEAIAIYEKINGIETIPVEVMRVIVDYENKNSKDKSPGISLKDLKKKLCKKDLELLSSKGYEIYKYFSNQEYINYEGLKNGDLLAVKFNGTNYETENILECVKNKNRTINVHPEFHFSQRYKLVKIKL